MYLDPVTEIQNVERYAIKRIISCCQEHTWYNIGEKKKIIVKIFR